MLSHETTKRLPIIPHTLFRISKILVRAGSFSIRRPNERQTCCRTRKLYHPIDRGQTGIGIGIGVAGMGGARRKSAGRRRVAPRCLMVSRCHHRKASS